MLLEAARFAPTHKHTEPWRFQVIQGATLATMAEVQVKALFNKVGEHEASLQKAEKLRFNASRSSAVIAIVMKRDSQERLPLNDELWAVATAVQNIHLHARSLRIGGFWSTGAAVDFPEVREWLGLDDQDIHMGWLYLGKFSGDKKLAKERLPVRVITQFR